MLLEVKNVTQIFDQYTAVDDVSLDIKAGTFTAILGHNGAGKSTLFRMILGLDQPKAGTINYQAGAKIGAVFQRSILDDDLTVYENLKVRARVNGIKDLKVIDQLAEQLGLSSFINKRYKLLSGGQRRRVDIARALLSSPDILFLDEPTTGLDIQTRRSIWKLIKSLQNSGLAIVLTTHYLNEVSDADMVYVLDHGRIIAQNSAQRIIEQYTKPVLTISFLDKRKEFTWQQRTYMAEDNLFTLEQLNQADVLQLLHQFADQIENFEYRKGEMDDAFVALTGNEVQ